MYLLSKSNRIAIVTVLALAMPAPPAFAQNVSEWSPAVSVDAARTQSVNTSVNDGCPFESPDGHLLFLASNRVPGAPGSKDLDIWLAYRDAEDGPWGAAEPLPAPVNTGAAEFCPTPLPGNQLLFVSTRSNACGSGNDPDIYFTRLRMSPLGWTDPSLLPCSEVNGVNTSFEEFSPSFVHSDGRTFLFFSSNRDSGIAGVHKLYSTEMLPNGAWAPAEPVEELNSAGFSDARPNVRMDGLEIVFDSNRAGTYDVYIATRNSLNAKWSRPRRLAGDVNSDVADETRPSFSRDGLRLYFGSTRANADLGGAGADIYVTERSKVRTGWFWR
jgi:WD40 repeat protein